MPGRGRSPNTYRPGLRVDARLGIDHDGELYLLTKGDGWIRKLAAARNPAAAAPPPEGGDR